MKLIEKGWDMDWVLPIQHMVQWQNLDSTILLFGFKILCISCSIERLLASQEGLYSMELIN
jgi:hypothetical protein